MQNCPDGQLISNYLKGDEKSLEFLIKRYLKRIYNFVYHYVGNAQETEDITQDVFVKMWKNLNKFDQEQKFSTWLYAIAKNASIDFLKKKKSLPLSDFAMNKLVNEIIFSEDELAYAMEKLSPECRKIISLHNDAFSFKEIAGMLGKSINTIKSRYRRSIINLKKFIK
jgi:RNA polymerase sigma-70 factor (ECF subfamily)